MADRYVDSGASGANNGTSWTDAWSLLQTAVNTVAAGDTVYVASRHVEGASAAHNIYCDQSGGYEDPIKIISVTTGTTTYEKQTDSTGKINTSSGTLDFGYYAYVYGLNFNTDAALHLGQSWANLYFYDCDFDTTTGNENITFSSSNWNRLVFDKCRMTLGNSLYFTNPRFKLWFRGCTISDDGTTAGEPLFIDADDIDITFEDCDFSGMEGSDDMVRHDAGLDAACRVRFIRCALPTGWTTPTSVSRRWRRDSYEVSDTGTVSATHKGLVLEHSYEGKVEQLNTTYRTGGASDGDNNYSWRYTPNANVSYFSTLHSERPLTIWHDASGSRTLTVHLSGPSSMTNADAWVDWSSPSEAATATYGRRWGTTRAAPAASGSSLTAGASWTSGGAANYKIEVAGINPTEPGLVHVYFHVASNNTFYVDPKIELV